jgi:hypothetical protein
VTVEEAREAVEKAKRKAHEAARRMFPPGMTGMTSSIVQPARLQVLESMIIGLMAERSQHDGDFEMKALLEMRDYWEAVAEEIRS